MKKGILLIFAALLLAVGITGVAYASNDEFSEKIQKIFVTNTEPLKIKLDGEVGGGCTIPDVISVKQAPQKYEFKKNNFPSEAEMNQLSQDGWELWQRQNVSGDYNYIWRRPIN